VKDQTTQDVFDWLAWMKENHVRLQPVIIIVNRRKKTVKTKIWFAGRTQLGTDLRQNLVALRWRGQGPTPEAALLDLKTKLDGQTVSNVWSFEDGA